MRRHLTLTLAVAIALGPWFRAGAMPSAAESYFRTPTVFSLLIDRHQGQNDKVYTEMPKPDAFYAGIDTSRLYRFVVVKIKRPDGRVVERAVIPRDYFRRGFYVETTGVYRDRSAEDSEMFICEDPQNPTRRGIAPADIRDSGLEFGVLEEETQVEAISGSGSVSRIRLRPGEFVLYEPVGNADGSYEIAGLARCCGNKVVWGAGRIKRLPPEVVERIVERTVVVDRSLEREAPSVTNIAVIQEAQPHLPPAEPAGKPFPWKWVGLGALLTGAILVFALSGDDEPPCNVRLEDGQLKDCGTPRDRPGLLLNFSW